MTDGLYLSPCQEQPTQADERHIDLTTYAQWIELQPVSTLANMIDLIGAELYRRRWSAYGAECRQLAKEIRTTIKYHTEQMGTSYHE